MTSGNGDTAGRVPDWAAMFAASVSAAGSISS